MYFKSCRLQCGGHACEVKLILLVWEHMLRSSDSQDSALWALQCSWEDMVWERGGGRRWQEIAPPGWFTSFLLFYQFYFLGQIFLHFVCEAINSHSRTRLALQGTLGSQESLFAPSQLCHCSLFLPPTLAIQRSPSPPSLRQVSRSCRKELRLHRFLKRILL